MTGKPKMCPSCGKLVGLDRVCPYCGKDTGSVGARVRRLGGIGARGGHAVTVGLVLANLLAYLLIILVGGQQASEGGLEILVPNRLTLVRLGLQIPLLVADGEWWRIVMPIFLHLGLLHLVMNTLVLWVTGRQLEHDIGPFAFFFMYITAGVVGFAASQVAGIGGGGASGAVAGILGCTIVKRRISDGNFRSPVTQQAIQLVVLNGIFGLVVAQVNNVAHLGGLLSGAALGVGFGLFEGRRWAPRMWLAGAALAGVVVVAAVVAMLRWEPPPGLFDPSDRLVRAQQAVSCIGEIGILREEREAVVTPAEARAAMTCLDRAGPVEPELDRALATVRDGLRRVHEGHANGSQSGEREGTQRVYEGLVAVEKWIRVNYPERVKHD